MGENEKGLNENWKSESHRGMK